MPIKSPCFIYFSESFMCNIKGYTFTEKLWNWITLSSFLEEILQTNS